MSETKSGQNATGNDNPGSPFTFADVHAREQTHINALRGEEDGQAFFGLGFSGGGIRSATFNLGIVQALVEAQLFKRIDYLSVVSGGSYIGSWLSAQRYRHGLDGVESLKPDGTGESAAMRHLRRYSNYLTPRYGVLSVDTLAAVSNLVRNLVLNMSIFVALLLAMLLLPRLAAGLALIAADRAIDVLPWISALLYAICAMAIGRSLARLPAGEQRTSANAGWSQSRIGYLLVIPAMLASMLAGTYLSSTQASLLPPQAAVSLALVEEAALFGSASYLLLFLIWACAGYRPARTSSTAAFNWGQLFGQFRFAVAHVVAAAVAGAAGGALLCVASRLSFDYGQTHPAWYAISWGAGSVLTALSLTLTLHIGLAKRWFPEEAREWFGRVGGMVLGFGLPWLLLVGIAALAPALFDYGGTWLHYGGGLAWLGTTVGGLLLGRSSMTAATPEGKSNRGAALLTAVAPYVFILGLLGALSMAIAWGFGTRAECAPPPPSQETLSWQVEHSTGTDSSFVFKGDVRDGKKLTTLTDQVALRLCVADQVSGDSLCTLTLALIVALLIAFALAARVDVNLFSMHQFYRNRLTRAYLGASRSEERKPDPFTDFDPNDDLPLAAFAHQRPYLLINAALNITDSAHMEWQQRQAAAFTFAPLHCGFTLPGCTEGAYRPTASYLARETRWSKEAGGVRTGAAMAVSGAAANPNCGYHSSPAMNFLLALFNVRLGRWCGNPAHQTTWRKSSPALGLKYLIKELLGATGESDAFVNLSDGGHFENLGLYALVQRKCRLIVICDAGQDRDFNFEDLGNAVRKCRVDLHAEIAIDPRSMMSTKPCDRPRMVFGRIDYDDGTTGILVYIKPLLCSDEPADILHYAATQCEFPHQSTADQWFDESQFESYRQLGLHTGRAVFARPAWASQPALSNSAWIQTVIASLSPLIPPLPR